MITMFVKNVWPFHNPLLYHVPDLSISEYNSPQCSVLFGKRMLILRDITAVFYVAGNRSSMFKTKKLYHKVSWDV